MSPHKVLICDGIVQTTTEITYVEDVGTWRGNIKKIFIDIMVNEINKGNMDSGIVDPAFLLMRFHLMANSFFILKMIFFLNDLELPLIFVLFLKGKQNKKENFNCDSLFGKDSLRETKSGFGGQVTYREGTIRIVTPF